MHLDLADLVAADHGAIAELFGALGEERDDRFLLVHRLVDELSAHIAAEQQILLPALRDVVPGGVAMAESGQEEHRAMRAALAELEGGHLGEGGFEAALQRLRGDVDRHVATAENAALPALRQVIGADRMRDLGDIYHEVKQTVPSGAPAPPGPNPRFEIT